MTTLRSVDRIIRGKATIDGAGVHLKRIFGYYEQGLFDPFLLLDHFGSDDPDDYIAGFPWHPHRGIETVTYMLEGRVEHGDSMGNKGVIRKGDIQWMTAGSGIIHQEMPRSGDSKMYGFQLWVNLPKEKKMMSPKYRGIEEKDVKEIILENNVKVKVISGEFNGVSGPVSDISVNPSYFDINLPDKSEFIIDVNPEYTVFVYVYEGAVSFDAEKKLSVQKGDVALLKKGSRVSITSIEKESKCLFVSGNPINEPIAWRGPIVMNTEAELETAFMEYRSGEFLKNGSNY
jgi:redox-sensitive bicupin YhaK (pirin superfamily)